MSTDLRRRPVTTSPGSTGPPARPSVVRRMVDVALAAAVLAAAAYGRLAETPYRSLSDSTVLGAKAQDACSVVVALALLALAGLVTGLVPYALGGEPPATGTVGVWLRTFRRSP